MMIQEMLAPLLAFKLEHGDFDLVFRIRNDLLEIEAKPINKKSSSKVDILFFKSAYGGQGKADFGDFMEMLSSEIGV